MDSPSTPTTPSPIIHLTQQEAAQYSSKLHDFNLIFNSQKQSFNSTPNATYYLLSTKYLNKWIEFCEMQSLNRQQLGIMNKDLVDSEGQLLTGLVENQNFEIVSEKVYGIIKNKQTIDIPRKSFIVNNEKKVPIYLQKVTYLKLNHKSIREIDFGRMSLSDLHLKTASISSYDTITNFINEIKKIESISTTTNVRLWKNTNETTLQKVFRYIKEKTRAQSSNYKFDGLGKNIENVQSTIGECHLDDGSFFIAEVANDYKDFFFKSTDQKKCESCYQYKKLDFPCGCKNVSYCTEQCRQKDKRFHIRDCRFAQEKQLNQVLEMNINSSSLLGRVGLVNLGNTCFMNSCLQCLSNCVPLTDYFIKKYYETQINLDNPLGSQGKLAKNYAQFIKNVWCGSSSTYSPYSLKGAVAKLNSIFSGYGQHDSQQFFSFLVDGLHEDLNRIKKKPYVQSVDSNGRQDEVVALESWIAHTRRNQSIIVDLFTGQYKSKVKCPTCNMQSVTFDPFTTVSLPVPQQIIPGTLNFFVIFSNNKQKAKKMSFKYKISDKNQWTKTAARYLKTNQQNFLFYVLTVSENIYSFENTSKDEILKKIEVENKKLFLLELSEEQKKIVDRVEICTMFAKPQFNDKTYENLWLKRPFFFQKQSTTVLDIYKRIFAYIQSIYKIQEQTEEQYQSRMLSERPFKLVLKIKKTKQKSYNRIETKFNGEIQLDNDEQKLSEILSQYRIQECELDVRFTNMTVKKFSFDKMKEFSEEGHFDNIQQAKSDGPVTLDQCFNIFEAKQKLEQGNEWFCPNCKQHKFATKQMTIYKAPQILILHLKRFKNKGSYRKEKNETLVTFPDNLQMSKFLIDPTPMSTYITQLQKQAKYEQPSYASKPHQLDLSCDYQLFAVSNHFGGLGGGHYTAYGKNRGEWMEYNDSSVRTANEGSIKGAGAYLLFYQRKNGIQIL